MDNKLKPASTVLTPAGVGGGTSAALAMMGAGAATTVGAGVGNALAMAVAGHEMNADLVNNPKQKYKIDNYLKSGILHIRDIIFALGIGALAGGKIGAALGAGAGYVSSKSAKSGSVGTIGRTGLGAAFGGLAGGAVATVATYGLMQQSRISGARKTTKQVLSSKGRVRRNAFRSGMSLSDYRLMLKGLESNLKVITTVYIPETADQKALRERTFNSLKASIPFMPFNSIDSDIPTDPVEFLEVVSRARMQTIQADRLDESKVPSVEDIVKGALAFSKVDEDPNSLRTLRDYVIGGKREWTQQTNMYTEIMADSHVKTQLLQFVDNLPNRRTNEIYSAVRATLSAGASVSTANIYLILRELNKSEYNTFVILLEDNPNANNAIVKKTIQKYVPQSQSIASSDNIAWSKRADVHHKSADEIDDGKEGGGLRGAWNRVQDMSLLEWGGHAFTLKELSDQIGNLRAKYREWDMKRKQSRNGQAIFTT